MDKLHLTRRNWEALLIIGGLLITVFVVGNIIDGAFSFMESEWDKGRLYQKCNEMYLGDNWTDGLNLSLAKQCWENFK